MNAITAINPLHAEANLPAAADPVFTADPSLQTETVAVVGDTVDSASPAPADAPAPKLPQDEQLALDIENIDKQIEALQKRRDGKKQLLDNLDKLASIKEGSILVFTQGRAETTRQVEGVVIAIRDGQYKVSVGEGFDAENVVVRQAQIVDVKSA